jgi:hypothetical protein
MVLEIDVSNLNADGYDLEKKTNYNLLIFHVCTQESCT